MPRVAPALPVSPQLWCKCDRVLTNPSWERGAQFRQPQAPPFFCRSVARQYFHSTPVCRPANGQSILSIAIESIIILSGNGFSPQTARIFERENGYGHRRRTSSPGFHFERSIRQGSETLGFQGKEKRSAGILSARLEPHLHPGARLLCERHEAIRNPGRRSAWRQRGQRLVPQSLRRENGNQVFPAGRL